MPGSELGDGGKSKNASERLKQKKSSERGSSEKRFGNRSQLKWRRWRIRRLCSSGGDRSIFLLCTLAQFFCAIQASRFGLHLLGEIA